LLFSRSGTCGGELRVRRGYDDRMVGEGVELVGLEPTTFRLPAERSPN
jgi:hypothetical protein